MKKKSNDCTVVRSFSLKRFMLPLFPVILRGYPGLPNGLFSLPCIIIKLHFILIKKNDGLHKEFLFFAFTVLHTFLTKGMHFLKKKITCKLAC